MFKSTGLCAVAGLLLHGSNCRTVAKAIFYIASLLSAACSPQFCIISKSHYMMEEICGLL